MCTTECKTECENILDSECDFTFTLEKCNFQSDSRITWLTFTLVKLNYHASVMQLSGWLDALGKIKG